MNADSRPPDAPRFDEAFRGQLKALFTWRRDVRHFLDTPVSDALIADLLSVAQLSPSVGLSEPWRFVTVDDPARRAAVRASFVSCNAAALAVQSDDRAALYASLKLAGLDQAPCHLAVFAEGEPEQGGGLGRATMPEMVAYSAVMAVHTLWLAASAAGLGVGWVSIIDPQVVTAALDVPPSWQLIGYFCIGYPASEADTPELERLGWEKRQPAQVYRR